MIKIHLYASDSIRAYINSKKWQSIDQPNSLKSFNDGYCQNDSIEKKSQTLKKLLFWKVHGLKGKGGIHLLSHWIYLIKTTFIR